MVKKTRRLTSIFTLSSSLSTLLDPAGPCLTLLLTRALPVLVFEATEAGQRIFPPKLRKAHWLGSMH